MSTVEIEPLSGHTDCIPMLAAWFHAEWRALYGARGVRDVEASLRLRALGCTIPQALVAVAQSEVIGTVSLKQHDLDSRIDLSPWLAGLYVREDWRRRGVGAMLVEALVAKARALGAERLYLYTPASQRYYEKLGWSLIEHRLCREQKVAVMTLAL